MSLFTLLDLAALAWFLGAWLGYSLLIEKSAKGRSGLNAMMNLYRAARLCVDAGRHFNRGQRGFFFALGYLGWFLGPLKLALTGIVIVMWRRQFTSDSLLAFSQTPTPGPGMN